MKVIDILKIKGNVIHSTSGETSVYYALKNMAENNVGALMVIEQEKLIGIFSERDYARKIILQGKASQNTFVKEIMTTSVITIISDDTVETCMELMTKNKVRHLPVVDKEKIVGIISIGDVVKAIIQSQQQTIEHLQNYIAQ